MVKGVCGVQDERWRSMAMMGTGSRCRKCNEKSEVLEGRYVTLSLRMILEKLKGFSKDRAAGGFLYPELQFSPDSYLYYGTVDEA